MNSVDSFIDEYGEFTGVADRFVASALILANLEDQNYNQMVDQLNGRFGAKDWYNMEVPQIDTYGQELFDICLEIADEYMNSSEYRMLEELFNQA